MAGKPFSKGLGKNKSSHLAGLFSHLLRREKSFIALLCASFRSSNMTENPAQYGTIYSCRVPKQEVTVAYNIQRKRRWGFPFPKTIFIHQGLYISNENLWLQFGWQVIFVNIPCSLTKSCLPIRGRAHFYRFCKSYHSAFHNDNLTS